MPVHLGLIVISTGVELKLREKHRGLTGREVREAFQAPARPQKRWENHAVHGRRLVVLGNTAEGRQIIGWLTPIDESDGVWELRTARYV